MIGVSESAEAAGAVASTPVFAEWSFPAEAGSVRTARALVREALSDWGLHAVIDVTELLVSELVTNAMRYTSGPISLRMRSRATPVEGRVLVVEVSDPVEDPPHERVATPDDEGGRGLQLVACASIRWGTRCGKTGKTVWFELALPG
ncbi:ATP-binding protein [Streptomyces sp. SAJ15]|uniref:ATP-binding protein n=1 Tax=Streptomyces sp. SAJ15 TaxID=2011095 RepID=UPI001185697B|nr:ATP-binding protein [Streptomyces sp. SAJ15]TVL93942.1 hypothetical protein CD790_02685 [Streptomyces sp. SAJ15]